MSPSWRFGFVPPSGLLRERRYIPTMLFNKLRVTLLDLLLVRPGQTAAMLYASRQVPIYVRTRASLFHQTKALLVDYSRMLLFGHVFLPMELLLCQAMPLGMLPVALLSFCGLLLVRFGQTTAIPYGMRQVLIFVRTRATLFDMTKALLVDHLRMLLGHLSLLLTLYFCLSTGCSSRLLVRL